MSPFRRSLRPRRQPRGARGLPGYGAAQRVLTGQVGDSRAGRPARPASPAEVRAWRQLLISRQLAQPVKQTFREVYVLPPAEEAARDYSNRFAGHIFRQEQARALMKARSWTPVPVAAWDDGTDHGTARREYPPGADCRALRAEFFYDPALSLILSRAFLLASDTAITDESIVRQIGIR